MKPINLNPFLQNYFLNLLLHCQHFLRIFLMHPLHRLQFDLQRTRFSDILLSRLQSPFKLLVPYPLIPVSLSHLHDLLSQLLHWHCSYFLRNHRLNVQWLLMSQPLPQNSIFTLQHLNLPSQIHDFCPSNLQTLTLIIYFLHHPMQYFLLLSQFSTQQLPPLLIRLCHIHRRFQVIWCFWNTLSRLLPRLSFLNWLYFKKIKN